MKASHRRHDISDKTWELLEPHLPGREGVWGGIAKDNRLFINAGSGFCGPVRRGGICRRIWAIGRMCSGGFAAGGIKGCGKNCSRP